MAGDTITIEGREYRRFIPYPEPVTDGTSRCIACGQIDEPGIHDDEQCGMTASAGSDSIDFLGEDLETSDKPAGPVSRVVDRGKSVWCHELKTHPEPFQAIEDGSKTFELRLNDRGFEVGHWLHLREYQFATPGVDAHYTGRDTIRRVTYVLESGFPGLRPGYVIMGLEHVAAEPALATALARIHAEFPGAFWMLAYGRSKADEPPFGARILFSHDEVLGEGEGETAADAVLSAIEHGRTAQQIPDRWRLANGKPWTRNDSVTFDVIGLAGMIELDIATRAEHVGTIFDRISRPGAKLLKLSDIAAWSDEQCRDAELWAGAIHLQASDNDDVEVPPTPAHLEPYLAHLKVRQA